METLLLQTRCSKPAHGIFVVASLLWQTCPWKPCRGEPAVANLFLETSLLQICCSKPVRGKLVVAILAAGLPTAESLLWAWHMQHSLSRRAKTFGGLLQACQLQESLLLACQLQHSLQ